MSDQNSAATDAHNLWTADECAAYLRVSRSQIYAKAASGELPSVRVFSSLRFDPSVIKAWVAKTAHKGATVTDLGARRK